MVTLAADRPDESDEGANALRVMTWNIRYDNPRDGVNAWSRRKEWVAEIVEKQRVDILGTQEALARQFDCLRDSLPDFAVYGVGRDDGKRRGEFAPIFYRKERFELLDKGTFWLSPTPQKPGSRGWDAAITRIATWVKLRDRRASATFYAVNTHFDNQGAKARAQSAALLVERLSGQFKDHPVILTGDFNTPPKSPPYKTLIGDGREHGRFFRDAHEISQQKPAGPNSTWNGFRAVVPGRRIDFVFVTDAIKVRQHRILNEQRDGRFPSDHLPVVAVVELPH